MIINTFSMIVGLITVSYLVIFFVDFFAKDRLKEIINKFSVKKLHDDLDEWIFIGIGNDIVEIRQQRLEYIHLVKKNEYICQRWILGACVQCVKNENIPEYVLKDLALELKLPWYKRPTFWHLVRLNFKRFFKWK